MNKNNTKDSDRSLPKTDRRKFLKGAATSAAALAISPTAKAQDPYEVDIQKALRPLHS